MTPNAAETLIIHVLQNDCTALERAEFERRLETDGDFSAKVDEIKKWLKPLSDSEEELVPDKDLLKDILNDIDQSEQNED